MPTQCDIARPAKQVYHEPIDAAQRNMARQTPSYRPAPPSNQTPSRRVPPDFASQSLQQSLWLSDVADFSTSPPSLSRPFPGFGPSLRAGSISSGSLSDSGQPSSRPLQRPPSRDYLFSASPTRSVTLSISGSQPRHHTPSPVPSSHTLHSSRSFGAVSPHRSSASSVHAGGHLDLKRLMSKPAMQTSTPSTSLMQDSERSPGDPSSSRVVHSRYPTDSAVSRPPPSRSAHTSRERPSLNLNTVGPRSSSAPRRGHTSSPERREPSGDSQTGRSSRNVLRRRPSARSNPSTPTVSNPRPGEQAFSPPARSASIKQPDSGIPFISPPIPLVTSPNTRDLQAPTPPRTKTISSPSIPHVPTGLTPAGAVALAYKQQEQRREELAETASFNEAYQPSSSSNRIKPTHPERLASSGAESGEGTGGPYYTVFGGESGRLVAVGGPEDDWHYGLESRATMTPNAKPSPSPGSRSLTRKVSGSLKKVAGSIKRGEREQRELPASSGDEWKPYDGSKPAPTRDPSTSSQSRVVARTPSKTSLKPINLDTALDGKREFSPAAKLSPAAKTTSPSPREGSRPSPLHKVGKGRAHEHEEDASASSKWWKLVKRISTGGLREKYTASDAPPPVPALPPNLKTMPAGRTTMDMSSGRGHGEEVGENGVLLRRFMQSRSSLSGVRPNLSTPSKTPPSGGSPRTSTANGHSARSPAATAIKGRASTSGHRPSIATRSSSPGSSDMATSSMSNHNLTSSTRSSFSSYGEEIPPVPKTVGQYIISPSELSLMTKSTENVRSASLPAQQRPRQRTRSRSQTAPSEDPSFEIINSSFEDSRFPSLPLPPRRATTGAAGSPVSTSFNMDDALNGGTPSSSSHASAAIPPPLGEFGLNEPPPRPRRSARRAAPPNVEVPARSQSMSTAMPPTPQTPRGPPQVRVDVSLLRRPSTGALSYTAPSRQPSATSATSPHPPPPPVSAPASASASAPTSAVSQKRSPLTYREMESPRRVLTEKEKADKWEDLLERSARAGGTLHLGQAESRLMSDEPAAAREKEVQEDESFFDSYYSDA